MDAQHIDALARALSAADSRRHAIAAFLSSALGLLPLAFGASDEAAAKKRRK